MQQRPPTLQQRIQRLRRRIVLGSLLCGVIVLTVLLFVPVDEAVQATGYVLAEKLWYVYAPEASVVKAVEKPEGAEVGKGDVILVLDTTASEDRLAQIQAQLMETSAQLALQQAQFEKTVKLPLPKEFWHVQDEMVDAEKRAAQAEKDRERYRQMFERKLVSRIEYEGRELARDLAVSEVAKVKEKQAKLSGGLEESIINEAKAQINSVKAKLDSLGVQERLCRDEIARGQVRAPIDGRVTLLIKKYEGESVVRGEPLAHVSSGPPNRARLLVGESQMHRVRKGQRVRFVPRTFETFRYGEAEGQVDEVSVEPAGEKKTATDDDSKYRVIARIEKTPVPLVLGSTVDAQIVLKRKPLWKLLLPVQEE